MSESVLGFATQYIKFPILSSPTINVDAENPSINAIDLPNSNLDTETSFEDRSLSSRNFTTTTSMKEMEVTDKADYSSSMQSVTLSSTTSYDFNTTTEASSSARSSTSLESMESSSSYEIYTPSIYTTTICETRNTSKEYVSYSSKISKYHEPYRCGKNYIDFPNWYPRYSASLARECSAIFIDIPEEDERTLDTAVDLRRSDERMELPVKKKENWLQSLWAVLSNLSILPYSQMKVKDE